MIFIRSHIYKDIDSLPYWVKRQATIKDNNLYINEINVTRLTAIVEDINNQIQLLDFNSDLYQSALYNTINNVNVVTMDFDAFDSLDNYIASGKLEKIDGSVYTTPKLFHTDIKLHVNEKILIGNIYDILKLGKFCVTNFNSAKHIENIKITALETNDLSTIIGKDYISRDKLKSTLEDLRTDYGNKVIDTLINRLL